MSDELYDNFYLKATLSGLEDEVHDLSTWSVYNDDEFNEEISKLEEIIRGIKEKSKERVKSV